MSNAIWDYESISLTNKQQSLMLYVFTMFIEYPYLLKEFNLSRQQVKDINGRYVKETILHNRESLSFNDIHKKNPKSSNIVKTIININKIFSDTVCFNFFII